MSRLTLVVGDGFTQSYCHHMGLTDRVMTAPARLLPPPDHVEYIPGASESRRRQALWSSAPCLFPMLHRLVDSQKLGFLGLCGRVSKLPYLNYAKDRRRFSLDPQTIQFQLRVYLWYLFKYYDEQMSAGVNLERLVTWPWYSFLKIVSAKRELSVISFNYECLIENILASIVGVQPIVPWTDALPVSGSRLSPSAEGACRVLKPHGSIALRTSLQPAVSFRWFDRFLIEDIEVAVDDYPTRSHYPPEDCPVPPDIVPPGHDVHHLSDPFCCVSEACKRAFAAADHVVVCGLSAAKPDTKEIASYFNAIPSGTLCTYVGTDPNCMAARLLHARATDRYSFVPGRESVVLFERMARLCELYE